MVKAGFFKTATYQNKSLPVHKMVFQHYQKPPKHNTKITVSNMFRISILMPETFLKCGFRFQCRENEKKAYRPRTTPTSPLKKMSSCVHCRDPPEKVTCELSLLSLSPPSLRASSPGVPRGTGVGEGKGEESLHSHLIKLNICIPEWDVKC